MEKLCRYSIWSLALTLLFSACNPGSSKDTSASAVPLDELTQHDSREGFIQIDLSEEGLTASLALPDRSKRGVSPSYTYDDIRSIHSIQIGRGFSLQFREEDRSTADILSECASDMLWHCTVVEEGENYAILERSLPDGSSRHHHFVAHQDIDGRRTLFFSDPMQEFQLEEVQDMLYSAQSFEWLDHSSDSQTRALSCVFPINDRSIF